MRKLEMNMFVECYGTFEIEIPDELNVDDKKAIEEYVRSVWDDIPIPSELHPYTDEPDFDGEIKIWNE